MRKREQPEGVWTSGTAYDQVKNKIALEFDYVGEVDEEYLRPGSGPYRCSIELSSWLAEPSDTDTSRRYRIDSTQ